VVTTLVARVFGEIVHVKRAGAEVLYAFAHQDGAAWDASDTFLHVSDFDCDEASVYEGQRVSWVSGTAPNGRACGKNVRLEA